ncbi:methylmalonyl-CoA/ethylmalonyl-CoA epimerase [Pseudooceanicola antarcticus]|uniref:Methylmalonyl-CoA epimerase n=1 Tax=Pseudooceanicola antarcticus TaxID=1247613 RepID=A0A285HLM6_9RHOB|nr:VOC family protein [Pseudooceanicola antarcticus]PJE27969.1 methylmalonyl-CoA epimerase [Pseudooceanicola antarcticus]SNY35591.1 methylmalonyl-CoA/ethylmalonyl-CoA epimerase [Pseudooceanicola antarcticus]
MNMKSDNPNVRGIKHMAFAVSDAEKALEAYARYLHVPAETEITHFPKSGNKVALFYLGGIEYQLCQSTDPDGRFASWIRERGAEGLHHICYEVDDIDAALAHAQKQGASLRECKACQKTGSHAHPEGWVAFLDNDAGGIEIEFMQVYTPEQLAAYEKSGAEAV